MVTYSVEADNPERGFLASIALDGSDERSIVERPGSRGAAVNVGPAVSPERPVADRHSYDSPSWSPDGKRIALVQDGHVAVVSADGAAAPKRITDEPVLKEWRPSRRPDGTRIVFTRDPGTILVVDPDGSHLAEVPFGKPATGAVWGAPK